MDVLGHEEFVCPNGHSFIGVRAVRCEECEAPVACVPLAVEIALREQLEGAVDRAAEAEAAVEALRTQVLALENDGMELAAKLGEAEQQIARLKGSR